MSSPSVPMASDPPAASSSDPLTHPLFANTFVAASKGSYTNAFKGIAALIDEEDEDTNQSNAKDRSTSIPTSSTHFDDSLQSTARDCVKPTFTWTRPSAIRVARLKAERADKEKRNNSNAQLRAHPYQQRAPNNNKHEANSIESNNLRSSSPSSSSSYGAIRSHSRRQLATSSRAIGLIERMSARDPDDFTKEPKKEDEPSAGEITLMMNMWK